MVEGPARSGGGSSLAPTIARREAAGALAYSMTPVNRSPNSRANWGMAADHLGVRSTFPGGREIHDGQIDQLLGSLFIGEQSARLDYLPDSSVEPFNRIDRIDLRTDLRRELEERDHLCPGPFPDLDDGRVLFAHGRIPKTLQSTFCSVGIHCLIDGLELLAHGRSVLLRNE